MAFPSQIEHSTSESARLQDLGIDVLLVRHGESEHNLHVGVLDGHDDPGLTERGKRESVQTGAYLGKRAVDMVVTSQKRRAIETYERMGPFLADVPFAHDARLNEQDYGWASGMHKEDVYTGRTEQILQDQGYDAPLIPDLTTGASIPDDWRNNPAEIGRAVHDRLVSAVIEQSAKLARPIGRTLLIAVISHSATIKNTVGVECEPHIPREHMFGPKNRYPLANGAVWELRAGIQRPHHVFEPRLVTPATAPIRRSVHGQDRSNGQSHATTYA